MGIQFVKPETVRLPLNGGEDYIVIRRRLTHGEQDAMYSAMRPPVFPDGSKGTAPNIRTGKVLAYLIGWSSSVPMSPELAESERNDTIKGLDPDSFDEIYNAINSHVEAMDQKKVPTGANESLQTSTSPVAVVGATNG